MTNEDDNSPERAEHVLRSLIDRQHQTVILEAMWDPSIADPEIHLTDEELDAFLQTFSDDKQGERIKKWIEGGAVCESRLNKVEDEVVPCENKAVGSVDWSGVKIADSILTCRQDLRAVYADSMSNGVRLQGLSPNVTINGKEIPKPQK